MILEVKLKQLFSPIVVILVTCALFVIDHFKINPDYHEIIAAPVFWMLTAYWAVALFIYKNKAGTKVDIYKK